jgi:pilus assembly protein Flp/PilA
LRVAGGAHRKAVAQPLPFHAPSRGSRNNAWSHFAHTALRVDRDAPEERHMTMELITRLRSLVKNDEGQDLLEYALLVALIALVCVGAIGLAGTHVNTIFGNIAAALVPSA